VEAIRNYFALDAAEEALIKFGRLRFDLEENKITTKGRYEVRLLHAKAIVAKMNEVLSSGMEQWYVTQSYAERNSYGNIAKYTYHVQRPKGSWLEMGAKGFCINKWLVLRCESNLFDRD
jgi:hypothetical protein